MRTKKECLYALYIATLITLLCVILILGGIL